MLKPVNIIKGVILVATLLILFLSYDYYKPVNIKDGYVHPFSLSPGDETELFFNPVENNKKATFRLFDVSGNIIDSVRTSAALQDTNANAFKNGYGYKPVFKYKCPSLKSGIYLWDQIIPFLVKNKNAEIIIIYPYLNRQAYSDIGGKSFFGHNSTNKQPATELSLHRPLSLNEMNLGFIRWVERNLDQSITGFATDEDIETIKEQFPKARVLVYYGDVAFWTNSHRSAFDNFISEGGNALIIGSTVMNNRMRYNKNESKIIFYGDPAKDPEKNPEKAAITFNTTRYDNPNYKSLGMDYTFGGTGIGDSIGWDGFKVTADNNPILNKTGLINGNILKVPTIVYNSAPIISSGNLPVIDNEKITFHRSEPIAYDISTGYNGFGTGTGMIASFQKSKRSGHIIVIGSTQWLDQEILKGKEITIITKNAIQTLYSGVPPFTKE